MRTDYRRWARRNRRRMWRHRLRWRLTPKAVRRWEIDRMNRRCAAIRAELDAVHAHTMAKIHGR